MKVQQGWIGVDLDGTLAEYGVWMGPGHVGPPVPRMVQRVKAWLAEGREVRIVTARANPIDYTPAQYVTAMTTVEEWCEKHIGRRLPVTCSKDYRMVELWDDRAIQVIPNVGLRVDNGR